MIRAASPSSLEVEIREEWTRLTRFYGICPTVIARMPRNIRRAYLQMQPVLEAEEHLTSLQSADWPWLEKDDRDDFHRKLLRHTRHSDVEDVAPASVATEEGRVGLAGLGIKVVQE